MPHSERKKSKKKTLWPPQKQPVPEACEIRPYINPPFDIRRTPPATFRNNYSYVQRVLGCRYAQNPAQTRKAPKALRTWRATPKQGWILSPSFGQMYRAHCFHHCTTNRRNNASFSSTITVYCGEMLLFYDPLRKWGHRRINRANTTVLCLSVCVA